MKRIRMIALLALGLATLGSSLHPAVAAPPPPSFAAVLSDDGACAFTVVATWKGAKVATVHAQFFIDSIDLTGHLFTMTAPGTGPNAGTLRGRQATFETGALAPSAEAHSFHVLVDFVDSAGANLTQMPTNALTLNCARWP